MLNRNNPNVKVMLYANNIANTGNTENKENIVNTFLKQNPYNYVGEVRSFSNRVIRIVFVKEGVTYNWPS